MTKYAEKENPQYDELVEQIDANRESIKTVKTFWKRFAISCFAFVAVLSTYICVSGLNLWDKNIEVNKLYEADVAKLLTQLGEANAEKENLHERLEAEQVLNQQHRAYIQKGRKAHEEQAITVRNLLLTFHLGEDSPALRDDLADWWTEEHMRDERGVYHLRFHYGALLIEQLARTWRDGNPRFGRRNEYQSCCQLANAED